MKDHRFIELVNLYIDRQITAEETAELEAEMQGNPRRRAIYRQYCQLHSATKQVYQSFRANATEPQAGAPTGRVITGKFARRAHPHWIHYAGGLTAAACLAVAFVRYNASSQPATVILATAEPAPAIQVAATGPSPAPRVEAPATVAPAPALVRLSNNPAAEPDYTVLLATMRQEEQQAFDSGQILTSRTPSLFDDGVFDARQVRPAFSQRVFRGKQTPGQQTELTVFQFQR